jgi:hypothetical protein
VFYAFSSYAVQTYFSEYLVLEPSIYDEISYQKIPLKARGKRAGEEYQ